MTKEEEARLLALAEERPKSEGLVAEPILFIQS